MCVAFRKDKEYEKLYPTQFHAFVPFSLPTPHGMSVPFLLIIVFLIGPHGGCLTS